jgi:hypothetical protein
LSWKAIGSFPQKRKDLCYFAQKVSVHRHESTTIISMLFARQFYVPTLSNGKASTFSFHGAKSIQECIDPSRSSLDFAVQIKEKAAKDFHVEHENGNADAIDGGSRQESGQYEVVTFLTSSGVQINY